jgi:adenylate cyclase class IV
VTDRRNIEVKARCRDLAAAEDAARRLGARRAARLRQHDTYFHVPEGRLKLREIEDADAPGSAAGELIFYVRPDRAGARRSDYTVADAGPDIAALRSLLGDSLGVRTRVRKERVVYRLDAHRIHLDAVEGLGTFVEIERVMASGDADAAAHAEVERLAEALGVRSEDVVPVSYADLLDGAAASAR